MSWIKYLTCQQKWIVTSITIVWFIANVCELDFTGVLMSCLMCTVYMHLIIHILPLITVAPIIVLASVTATRNSILWISKVSNKHTPSCPLVLRHVYAQIHNTTELCVQIYNYTLWTSDATLSSLEKVNYLVEIIVTLFCMPLLLVIALSKSERVWIHLVYFFLFGH